MISVLGASLGDEGGADIVNRSLDLLRDMTPSDKWMNTIVSYTMWWVITHRTGICTQVILNIFWNKKNIFTRL